MVISTVQMFDSSGMFIRHFTLPPRSSGQSSNAACGIRPYGLCATSSGHVLVCDRDGHRILMFTSDGQFVGDLLQLVDPSLTVKYPCDVTVIESATDGILMAVTESCNGLLDIDIHHAVKLYSC